MTDWIDKHDSSPEGRSLLARSPTLQHVVATFLEAPSPERAIGGQFIGTGKYSSVRLIDGVAVKISSPTSSEWANESGKPTPAEDLMAQFTFLRAFRTFLVRRRQLAMVAPRQYFVFRSRFNGHLLVQEYMDGWVPIGDWTDEVYGPDQDGEFRNFVAHTKDRIRTAVAGTQFVRGLNDLRLEPGRRGLHGANILIPRDARPQPLVPLCIIDQPAGTVPKKG